MRRPRHRSSPLSGLFGGLSPTAATTATPSASSLPSGAEAIIPPSSSRVRQIPYDPIAYRQRNLVERLWCRLKDWRRIATRYDELARNYLASVYLAAVLIYWTN
jgi:transposase